MSPSLILFCLICISRCYAAQNVLDLHKEQCNALTERHFWSKKVCYVLNASPANYSTAQRQCSALPNPGVLAHIKTPELARLAISELSTDTMWVGLYQKDKLSEPNGSWVWGLLDGSAEDANDVPWFPDQPNDWWPDEECATLIQQPGKLGLADRSCGDETASLCQYLDGYQTCNLTNGLLLQNGHRCLQVFDVPFDQWSKAMEYCNERGGHLFHIYSSKEKRRIAHWLRQNSLAFDGWAGHKKLGPLANDTTGHNVFWMTSKTENIGIDQSVEFNSLLWYLNYLPDLFDVGYVDARVGSLLFGEPKFASSTLFPSLKIPICQFAKPKKMNCFQNYPNSRSPAPVYQEIAIDHHPNECARACGNQLHCMGYNVVKTPTPVCQLVAQQIYDTGMRLVVDNDSSYYAKSE